MTNFGKAEALVKINELKRKYNSMQKECGNSPIKVLKVDLTGNKKFRLAVLSDLHIGDMHCEFEKLARDIKILSKMKNVKIIINGDVINNALKDAPPDAYNDILAPGGQIETAIKLLEPIKDKIVCFVSGNHEQWTSKKVGYDPAFAIASGLGLEDIYAPQMFMIDFNLMKFEDKPIHYVVAGRHGSGGGRMPGSALNKVNNDSMVLENVDLQVLSHVHGNAFNQRDSLRYNYAEGTLEQVTKSFIVTNSYQGYGDFSAKNAMIPSTTDLRVLEIEAGLNPDYNLTIYQNKDGIRKPRIKFFINDLDVTKVKATSKDKYTKEDFEEKLNELSSSLATEYQEKFNNLQKEMNLDIKSKVEKVSKEKIENDNENCMGK